MLKQLVQSTPARIAVGRSGTRPPTAAWLGFRQDHARARDAVEGELSQHFLTTFVEDNGYPIIQSLAESRRHFVLSPPSGKRTTAEHIATLLKVCPLEPHVQIVISDGLSAKAVETNVPQLLPMLEMGLKQQRITMGLPIVVKYARVAIADQIGEALKCQLVINLIGERPGLSCSAGLSAYMTLNPGCHTVSSDRTVVSNIHERGTPAVEAGAYIAQLAKRILDAGVSGVRLQSL